jgi:hypothetical protein
MALSATNYRYRTASFNRAVRRQQFFEIEAGVLTSTLGHGVCPLHRVGDVEHHQHAMATSRPAFLHNEAHSTVTTTRNHENLAREPGAAGSAANTCLATLGGELPTEISNVTISPRSDIVT